MSASRPAAPELGLWQTTALVVGHTIAVGIFLTPAQLIGASASPALSLGIWLVGGVLVLAGAFTFGELASRFPLAGGPYIYLREGWGGRLAFLYGWQSLLIMDPGVTAALATGLSEYVVLLWPAVGAAKPWLAITLIWVLAGVSMWGLTLSARVLASITAVKLFAFAAIVIGAFVLGSGSWSHFEPFLPRRATGVPLGEAIALALVSVFFSFGGFWEASRVAGDVRNARRSMPAALTIGVACATVVYAATTMAFIYLVPVEQATSASEFARCAGEALLGPAGPSVLACIVVLSVVASVLALLIMAPRLYVAMGRDGLFPSSLAALNARTRTPARATAVLALLASLFVLVGTFEQIVAFFMCTTLGFIALAAGALIRVRQRAPEPAAFSAPGYPVTVVLFVLLVLTVAVLVAVNRPAQALVGFALVLTGLPVYRLGVLRRPVLAPRVASESTITR